MKIEDVASALNTRPANVRPKVTVLGAGPAGIAAAYALTKDAKADVTVYERAAVAGGNSTSFQIDGIWCDYGSHRFHPVADPDVLADVKAPLGGGLLLQPRHGRIRLGGKWIHFPLKPADALLRLPKPFAASLLADMVMKPLRKRRQTGERSFSTVLYDGLGPTISENFYFPYVRKLWGLDPDKLSVTLAERRVSGSSVGKILGKMMRMLPGMKGPTTGRFYYPRRGFGQISEAMVDKATAQGAKFHFGSDVTRIRHQNGQVTGIYVRENGRERRIDSDQVFSTIPLTTVVRLLDPPPPPEVVAAAKSIPISRMSEPKNYNSAKTPTDRTILCAELPCDPTEAWWGMSDEELGRHYVRWLGELGLPVTVPVIRCETRRLQHAYPVYDLDYQRHFETIDRYLLGLKGLLSFGRQGLFAHDNTHHAFAMAYAAAGSLRADGTLDEGAWAGHRHEFESHRVED